MNIIQYISDRLPFGHGVDVPGLMGFSPLSAWHTKDWKLPEAQRRPSEYPLRYSPEEMEKLAADHGYKILRHTLVRARVPRRIYMMQKIA